MAREYLYFPGCSLKGTGIAYEESLLAMFKLLDVGLRELEDWNCCGATSYMSIDETQAFELSARNLSLASLKGGGDLLAPCSACYLVLRKTQDYVARYPEIRKRVESSLWRAKLPMMDGVKTRHPLEVLYTDVGVKQVKAKSVRKWQGGPVACYYGCQAIRPYYEVDKPVRQTRMEELFEAAGIPAVDFALKTKCCGGSLTGTIHDVGVRLNYILLKEAVRKGAQALVTICPLCQFNLDAYQAEIRRREQVKLDVPVLYFTQVLGWALGADFRALGLQRCISGASLVKQWFSGKAEVAAHV
jgi:heterodisulfide reductase subunit B